MGLCLIAGASKKGKNMGAAANHGSRGFDPVLREQKFQKQAFCTAPPFPFDILRLALTLHCSIAL